LNLEGEDVAIKTDEKTEEKIDWYKKSMDMLNKLDGMIPKESDEEKTTRLAEE